MQPNARPIGLIDTHAHLATSQYNEDLDDVLSRARVAGVVQIVAIGTTEADSREVVGLTRQCEAVFAAVGIHPNEAIDAGPGDWASIEVLARERSVVALGETGLDRYWDRTPFPLQQEYFDRHLDLAKRLEKAVVIHSRDCMDEVIAQVARSFQMVRGVLHSFSGTWREAEACMELGLYLSFAGTVTFRNKSLDPLREVASRMSLDRLLIETDSPYLSPHPDRGKRNEPSRIVSTARMLAELQGISFEEFADATSANARHLFGLPEPVTESD